MAVIVLNWNNPSDTLRCLRSLADIERTDYEVIVVDNGSSDDSAALVRRRHPTIRQLETGCNLGYAGGNNVGIRYALAVGAQNICILNNDVTVEPNFLEPLLATLRSQQNCGIVTPLIAEAGSESGCVWALGSTLDRRTAAVTRNLAGAPVRYWQQQPSFEVQIASGAAMLIKREVLERVGLMDEGYFLYYEEVDWSLRVRQAGYQIVAVPSSIVYHKVSASLGKSSPVVDYYMLRNHLRLIMHQFSEPRRSYLWIRVFLRNLFTIVAYTVESHNGERIGCRDARVLAIRDALLRRCGEMGADVASACHPR